MRVSALIAIAIFSMSISVFGQQATTQISSVSSAMLTQTIVVSGQVESFNPSRSERAPNSIQLKDASGSIRVAIWPDVFNQIVSRDQIKPGAQMSVRAEVAEFRGKVELHVNAAGDVVVGTGTLAPGPATSAAKAGATTATTIGAVGAKPAGGVTNIAEVTRERMGQEVTISGSVTSARKPSTETAPYIIKVTDTTGAIDVVFWKDLADQLSDLQKPNVGDKLRVIGKISEHRGTLQIRVEDPKGIQTQRSASDAFTGQEKPAGAAIPVQVQPIKIGDLNQVAPGQRVRVSGTVQKIDSIRAGREVTLRDNGATARVLLWDTAEGLMPELHALKINNQLELHGVVAEATGTKVLVVQKPEEVVSVK